MDERMTTLVAVRRRAVIRSPGSDWRRWYVDGLLTEFRPSRLARGVT